MKPINICSIEMVVTAGEMTMRDDTAIDRAIKDLCETDGDNCTICRKPLIDRAPTFFGTRLGQIVLTSNCCASKLETTYTIGTYLEPGSLDVDNVSGAILRAHNHEN